MAKKQLADLDFNSQSRLLNLLDAVGDQEPATFAQLKAQVEGLNWKDNVRVASVSNLNLAAPGATIDGITMVSGDRFLAKDQSSQPANGIYVWNGAATPATRSLDTSTSVELENAVVTVDEGTSALATFRQTSVNFTLDSGNVVWGSFGAGVASASETVEGKAELATQAETDTGTDDLRIVTPLKAKTASWMLKRHAAQFGDGAATQYDITHSFGSRDIAVEVYRNSSPWDTVGCDVERPDTNTVRLKFAVAPTSNQFRVVIKY